MKQILKHIRDVLLIHKYEVLCLLVDLAIAMIAIARRAYGLFALIPLFYFVLIGIEYAAYVLKVRTPLDIKTPDGSGEPYHPSVLYFGGGLHGYRYWMAFTPMPMGRKAKPYVDRWEMPCVYASNDGINFTDVGGKGFLDDLTPQEIANHDFFSDAHLVYNKQQGLLELYYRLSSHTPDNKHGDGTAYLLRKTSKDGISWSPREVLTKVSESPYLGKTVVSPALIMDEGEYKMWYVSSYASKRTVSMAKSKDGYAWYDAVSVIFHGRDVDPWHIDCTYHDGKYRMLVYEFSNHLTLWESTDGIAFYFKETALKQTPVLGSFYHDGLYRSCMVFDERQSIYFSSRCAKAGCNVGIARRTEETGPFIVQNGGKPWPVTNFVNDALNKYFYFARKTIRALGRNIK